jgi:hypothetical protein
MLATTRRGWVFSYFGNCVGLRCGILLFRTRPLLLRTEVYDPVTAWSAHDAVTFGWHARPPIFESRDVEK